MDKTPSIDELIEQRKVLHKQRLDVIADYHEKAAPSATHREKAFRRFNVGVEHITQNLSVESPAGKHLVDEFLETVTTIDPTRVTNSQLSLLKKQLEGLIEATGTLIDKNDAEEIRQAFGQLLTEIDEVKVATHKNIAESRKLEQRQARLDRLQEKRSQIENTTSLTSAKVAARNAYGITRAVTGSISNTVGGAVARLTGSKLAGRAVRGTLNVASAGIAATVGVVGGALGLIASHPLKQAKLKTLDTVSNFLGRKGRVAQQIEQRTRKLALEHNIANKTKEISAAITQQAIPPQSGAESLSKGAQPSSASDDHSGVFRQMQRELATLNHTMANSYKELVALVNKNNENSGSLNASQAAELVQGVVKHVIQHPVKEPVSQAPVVSKIESPGVVHSESESQDARTQKAVDTVSSSKALEKVAADVSSELSETREANKKQDFEEQQDLKWKDELLETVKKIEAMVSGSHESGPTKSSMSGKKGGLGWGLLGAGGTYLLSKLAAMKDFFKKFIGTVEIFGKNLRTKFKTTLEAFKVFTKGLSDTVVAKAEAAAKTLKEFMKAAKVSSAKKLEEGVKVLENFKNKIFSFADNLVTKFKNFKMPEKLSEFLGHLAKLGGYVGDAVRTGAAAVGEAGGRVVGNIKTFATSARVATSKTVTKLTEGGKAILTTAGKVASSLSSKIAAAGGNISQFAKAKLGPAGEKVIQFGKLVLRSLSGGAKITGSVLEGVGTAIETVAKIPGVGMILRALGPIGLAVSAGMAMYEGYKGYKEAVKEGSSTPLRHAAGAAIESLATFGITDLVDKIFGTHSSKAFEALIDKMLGDETTAHIVAKERGVPVVAKAPVVSSTPTKVSTPVVASTSTKVAAVASAQTMNPDTVPAASAGDSQTTEPAIPAKPPLLAAQNPIGGPVFKGPSDVVRSALEEASALTAVPVATLSAIAYRESRFKPDAKNPKSSATGLFQIIDSTWNWLLKKFGDRFPQLRAGRQNPLASALGGALLTKMNTEKLQSAGISPNENNIYAAHFLGVDTAKKLYGADDGSTVESALGKDTYAADVKANPTLFMNRDGTVKNISQFKKAIALTSIPGPDVKKSKTIDAPIHMASTVVATGPAQASDKAPDVSATDGSPNLLDQAINGLSNSFTSKTKTDAGSIASAVGSRMLNIAKLLYATQTQNNAFADSGKKKPLIDTSPDTLMKLQQGADARVAHIGKVSRIARDPVTVLNQKVNTLSKATSDMSKKHTDKVVNAINNIQTTPVVNVTAPPAQIAPAPPVIINNKIDVADRTNYDNMRFLFT